jgi:hypothetical protein
MQTSSSHFTRHVPEIIIHCGFGKHESDPTDLKLSQIIFWLPQVRSFPCFHGACPLEIFPPASCSKSKVCLVLLSNCFYFSWFNRHSSPTPHASTGCEVLLFVKITRVAIGYERTASFFFLPPVNCPLLSLSLCAHILLSVTRVTAAAPLRWAGGGHGPHSGGAPPASSTDALPTPAAPHSSLYSFRAQARSVCYLVSTNPLLVL